MFAQVAFFIGNFFFFTWTLIMLGTAAAAAYTIPLIFVRRCRSDSRLRTRPYIKSNTICTHSVVLYTVLVLLL